VKQLYLFPNVSCFDIRLQIDMSLLHEWDECFARKPHVPVHVTVSCVYRLLHALLADYECVLYLQKYCISVKTCTALKVTDIFKCGSHYKE
jgi:hypothetical protein